MPRKDGTGPDGSGPKKVKQGTPTPKRDGSGGGRGRSGGRNNDRIGRGIGRGTGRGR